MLFRLYRTHVHWYTLNHIGGNELIVTRLLSILCLSACVKRSLVTFDAFQCVHHTFRMPRCSMIVEAKRPSSQQLVAISQAGGYHPSNSVLYASSVASKENTSECTFLKDSARPSEDMA